MNSMTRFSAMLDAHPEGRALVCKDFTATRQELQRASLRGAAWLHAMGLRRGDAVCVWLPDGGAWLQLLFGCAHLGVLLVPISTRLRLEEAKHIVRTAQAKAIFVPQHFLNFDYAGTARSIQAELAHVREVIEVVAPDAFIPVDASLEDVAQTGQAEDGLCTFSTSGTTGHPKLAVHSQAGIFRHAMNVAARTDITPDAVMLCGLSLYGVLGFVQMIGTLAGGASCVLAQVFDAARAAQAIKDHQVSHFFGSDGMLAPVLDVPGADLQTWRWGGFAEFAGLGKGLVDRAEADWGLRAFGLYGSSECFAIAAINGPEGDAPARRSPGGTPISEDIRFRIADLATGATVADGSKGELQIHGYNVMQAYLHNPQATAAAMTDDGWFRTGDLALRDGKGFVYLARIKDSLRLRGYLVDPTEIEEFLATHPAVTDAQVVGAQLEGVGDVAIAYIRTSEPGVGEAQLVPFCKAGMANYKVPLHIVPVADYPRVDGPNGTKIQKNKLREMAQLLISKTQGETV